MCCVSALRQIASAASTSRVKIASMSQLVPLSSLETLVAQLARPPPPPAVVMFLITVHTVRVPHAPSIGGIQPHSHTDMTVGHKTHDSCSRIADVDLWWRRRAGATTPCVAGGGRRGPASQHRAPPRSPKRRCRCSISPSERRGKLYLRSREETVTHRRAPTVHRRLRGVGWAHPSPALAALAHAP